jgi:hypothetical protein
VTIPKTTKKPPTNLPEEVAKITGIIGRMHGEIVDTNPAKNTTRYSIIL